MYDCNCSLHQEPLFSPLTIKKQMRLFFYHQRNHLEYKKGRSGRCEQKRLYETMMTDATVSGRGLPPWYSTAPFRMYNSAATKRTSFRCLIHVTMTTPDHWLPNAYPRHFLSYHSPFSWMTHEFFFPQMDIFLSNYLIFKVYSYGILRKIIMTYCSKDRNVLDVNF